MKYIKRENSMKYIKRLLVCLIACTTLFLLPACFIFGSSNEQETKTAALAAPQNVSFDKDSYILSWNGVENASGYKISYNDSIVDASADQTWEQIFITSQENSFKVKAVGDGVDYSDSGWSKTVTYTVEQQAENQSTFEKVNIELAKIAEDEGYRLQRVIGISYFNIEIFDGAENLEIQTVCVKNGKERSVRILFGFDNKIDGGNILRHLAEADNIRVYDNGEIVYYNSAKCLIISGNYDGEMQVLKDQGYIISVIDSCVIKGSTVGTKFKIDIIGTYKAQLGDDVKYFTSFNLILLNQISTDEKENYEQSVLLTQRRAVTETYFVMHEETMEYMNDLISIASSASSSN